MSLSSRKENVFLKRRKQLLEKMPPNSIAIIPSHPVSHRNGDNEYFFRQDSSFYFLTGFNERESIAILVKDKPEQFILFNRPKDHDEEVWTGRRA
jgi:Xaa-Pro aminopeptidase